MSGCLKSAWVVVDVVNVIDPDIAVITNIGLDHTDWLGDSIEKIALKKQGLFVQIFLSFLLVYKIYHKRFKLGHQVNAKLYVAQQDYFYQLKVIQSWNFASSGTTLKFR
jgi:dihydrofolate synthase/folylpolyglutamate synthase